MKTKKREYRQKGEINKQKGRLALMRWYLNALGHLQE
jgi:hypothetical protein